jgi:hypothetical protein
MRFSDGMQFNTAGPIHMEEREDGLYVVGGGMLIPVDTEDEAKMIIDSYTSKHGVNNEKP